ncbi:MAG: periplasmic heavy metal sensor [Desulfovibrio sp.]|nr:periplasmic heavy metal sensor [Desulfovibrio sp.]
MKRSLAIALSLVALTLCSVSFVGAYPMHNEAPCQGQGMPCPGFHGQGQGQGYGPCQSITAEQRAKYYALMDEYEPRLRELKDQLFIKKQELEALKKANQPDVNQVRAVATEIVKLQNAKRDLQKVINNRIAKECGIQRPQRPIPGVDCPFPGPKGPGPRGPMGPMGPMGPGPMNHM